MADVPMHTVEGLSIHAIELAHAGREISIKSFNDQVIMICHQTIPVAEPVELPANLTEQIEPLLPIIVMKKNIIRAVTTGSDVITSTRIFYTKWSSHICSYNR